MRSLPRQLKVVTSLLYKLSESYASTELVASNKLVTTHLLDGLQHGFGPSQPATCDPVGKGDMEGTLTTQVNDSRSTGPKV